MGGRALRLGLAVLLLGLGVWPAWANIRVRADISPHQAEPGESLTLVIEVQGTQDVEPPALSGLDAFDASYVGPSTQMSIVNNRSSASVRHRYTLRARKEGRFTLGPFRVEHQGREYQTETVEVEIRAGRPASPDRGARTRPGQTGQDVWLEITTPEHEVFLHQRVPLEVSLYVGGVRVADAQYPLLPGDGVALEAFEEPVRQRRTVGDRVVRVLRFRTTLVPLRSGTIELGPASLQLNVIRRSPSASLNLFDRFFSDSLFGTERRPRTLRSEPLSLRVRPLPEAGRPATFSGAVGQFALDVTAEPTQLRVGDPLSLRMVLNGAGRVTDAQPPSLTSAEGFRTYSPQMDQPGPDTTVFEQVLIPQDETLDAIPAVHFSYFDPEAAQYRTLSSRPIRLLLQPAPDEPAGTLAGGLPAQTEQLGQDIVYIKDEPGRFHSPGRVWYRSPVFWLWHVVPLGLLGAAVWYDRRRRRLSGDARYARFARAGKQARHGLRAAEQALAESDSAALYALLSRTLQDYLAAKLDLPPGRIEPGTVAARGVSADCVRRIAEVLSVCEQARFAPGTAEGDGPSALRAVEDIVGQLEREYTFPAVATDSPVSRTSPS